MVSFHNRQGIIQAPEVTFSTKDFIFASDPHVMLLLVTMCTYIICSQLLTQNKLHHTLINKLYNDKFLFECDEIYLCIISRLYFLFNIFSWCINIMHLILLKTISTCTLLINTYVKEHKYILHRYVTSSLILSLLFSFPNQTNNLFCISVHATNFMHCK